MTTAEVCTGLSVTTVTGRSWYLMSDNLLVVMLPMRDNRREQFSQQSGCHRNLAWNICTYRKVCYTLIIHACLSDASLTQ